MTSQSILNPKNIKVLYAFQGTGNGHVARARDIVPVLQRKVGQVDVLMSGIQADIKFDFPLKYKLYGMSFIFGKKGGVDILDTIKKTKASRLIQDIRTLPVQDYDLVINDFEPVSAWACRIKKVPCIGVSHQAAVLAPAAPKPKFFSLLGWSVLKMYAPTKAQVGFHFKRFADNIFTPVIRQEIRNLKPTQEGHYTVYLPAYSDEKLKEVFTSFPEVKWKVFSKHTNDYTKYKNVTISPVNNDAFIKSLESCTGVMCGAGFEAPAEALFLGKKLLVIPMQSQYEQHCNAAGLADLGVPVVPSLKPKYYQKIKAWLDSKEHQQITFEDNIETAIDFALEKGLELIPSPLHVQTEQAY